MHEPNSMSPDSHGHDPRGSQPALHVLGALALELAPAQGSGPIALTQHDAGALAALIARDLADFAPQAASLELVTDGAH
jgi:hypothetical protein